MFQYLLARAAEPSSYAGLAALLGVLGVNLAPAEYQAVVGVLTAVAAAVAVFLPDLRRHDQPSPPVPPTSAQKSGG